MIVTADLHLTGRERDSYRWAALSRIREVVQERKASHLLILGDLTDAKDGHDAKLVNMILAALDGMGVDVHVLMGNHDYKDPLVPFFGFLHFIPGLQFFNHPTVQQYGKLRALLLPHTTTPVETWDKIELPPNLDVIFCHQTFNGALAANGSALESTLRPSYWHRRGFRGRVYSGDIHKPQDLGHVTYVGTPYPVSFGDDHVPRLLEVTKKGHEEIRMRSIRKVVREIERAEDLRDLRKGDQVKVRLRLPRSEFVAFDEHRTAILAFAEKRGVEVHAVELQEAGKIERKPAAIQRSDPGDPIRTLQTFCRARSVPRDEREAGETILSKVHKN